METSSEDFDWEAMAEHTKTDVEEAIRELCMIVSNYDPIELISRVAVYILMGNPEKPKDSGGPAQSETNLEYLVSLVTAHPFPIKYDFPAPDTIQRTIELLTTVQMAAGWHYKLRRRCKGGDRTPLDEIADSFRMDKLHVRGDAYWPHLRLTIRELLETHDIKLKEILGFSSMDYLNLMERTEEELNKRIIPGHLKQLQHPRAGYALSFSANFETQEGIALATSMQPSLAQEIVLGRCADHCRQHGLKVMWVLLLGVPILGSDVCVMRVTPETSVSDHASRLLKQLEIQITEFRKTGSPIAD